jgi:hypothetical protein
MGILNRAKAAANALLSVGNVRIETLTAAREETRRLDTLLAQGHFDKPVTETPRAITRSRYRDLLDALPDYESRFEVFRDKKTNDVDYSYDNSYFSSPDTEILYTMLRRHMPKRIIEIGSGNSTRVIRQAILDGGFACELTSVDPTPRRDVGEISDQLILERVEFAGKDIPFNQLQSGDILFIDSSHEVKTGNDVLFLFLRVLPNLPPGTLVHVHDVFLPYDYPKEWVINERWAMGEQYLLATMLSNEETWDVVWPGYYLQKTLSGFEALFANRPRGRAQSFWMRKLE